MKRWMVLLALIVAGCSTAPIVDLLDYFQPGELGPQGTAPYGGVCVPTQLGAPVPIPAAGPALGESAVPGLPPFVSPPAGSAGSPVPPLGANPGILEPPPPLPTPGSPARSSPLPVSAPSADGPGDLGIPVGR